MITTHGARGWFLSSKSLKVVKRLRLHPGGPEMRPYIYARISIIMSASSPGIPPGGGVANRGSARWLRSPWLKAPLTSATHALARRLANIWQHSGTSEVSGVGTDLLNMLMSGS